MLHRQIPRAFVAAAAVFSIAACSHFRGPGDYKGAGQYQSHVGDYKTADEYGEYQELPPTGGVTWRSPRRTDSAFSEVNFDWPVDQARLTQGFQVGKKVHWGVDLAGPKGTPILAAERGTVVYTGSGFHGYGKLVVIEHGSEWATLYSHLSKITVHEGQEVHQGETIGAMGRTGHATGNHLHFEIRKNRQPVNPLALLPQEAGGLTARTR